MGNLGSFVERSGVGLSKLQSAESIERDDDREN